MSLHFPRIQAVRHYFHWRGRQGPLLGLRVESLSKVGKYAETLGNCGLHALELPKLPNLDAGEGIPWSIEEAAQACDAAGLSFVLPITDSGICDERQRDLILAWGKGHPGVLIQLVMDDASGVMPPDELSDQLAFGPLEDFVDARIPTLLSIGDVTSAAAASLSELRQVAAANGCRVKGAADPIDALIDALLVYAGDRPSVVQIDGDAEAPLFAHASASILAGAAMTILPTTGILDRQDGLQKLEGFLQSLLALPLELPEPNAPSVDYILARGGESRQELRETMRMLSVLGKQNAGMRQIRDVDAEQAAELLFVPVAGVLGAESWQRLLAAARQGSRVAILGLCLEGGATPKELLSLGLSPEPRRARREDPGTMQGLHPFDCGGRILEAKLGRGSLYFSDRVSSWSEEKGRADGQLLNLLARCGIGPSSYLEETPGSFGRELAFGLSRLTGIIGEVGIHWRP